MSRTGLRARKNAAVKRAFFEAAMQLFMEKGFDNTSVDEIAERAGFSRATYFNHFGTKEGVVRHYGEQVQLQMEQLLREADPASSPLERIRRMLLVMAREADARGDEVRLIYQISMRDTDYLSDPSDARTRVLEMLAGLLTEAQHLGEVRHDLPAVEIAFHVLYLYNSAILAAISGQGGAESLVGSVWGLILDGVRRADTLAE